MILTLEDKSIHVTLSWDITDLRSVQIYFKRKFLLQFCGLLQNLRRLQMISSLGA